ncbi:DUF6870 family protein [Anaerosporobacter sp.]|uniref:DUF6870 family protein n=1 Tax=Anaerosporobacter sp. TaxID=1872529 RepID=UPI00286EF56A|nr:hypothetical protein [Anaerosporobacter sp.]
MTIEELKRLQNMNIMELDREQLANAEDIIIDSGKCVDSRIKSYMEQMGNPFAQNVGEYVLQIGFQPETNELIDDRMVLLTKRKIQIIL